MQAKDRAPTAVAGAGRRKVVICGVVNPEVDVEAMAQVILRLTEHRLREQQ
jgi:hypothetical protein